MPEATALKPGTCSIAGQHLLHELARLDADSRHIDQLRALYQRPWKKVTAPLPSAICAGLVALKMRAEDAARNIRDQGGLLYAWAGSSALAQEGGAA